MHKIPLFFLLIIAVSCAACSANKYVAKPSVYFESFDKSDTADFCHIVIPEQPFSVELLGSVDTVTETTITFHIQIGIYNHGMAPVTKDNLIMNDMTVTALADNLAPIRQSSFHGQTQGPPYAIMSYHRFVFDRAALARQFAETHIAAFQIFLDKFITYNGKSVAIEPVSAFLRIPASKKG
ncbi:MAG: hypothetical protein R3F48_07625 [Candidatus Zixiibacteriota bacterium]